jgi:hypothetical protein
MTFLHFMSLGSLVFGPIYILYHSSKMTNSRSSLNLVYGFVMYSLTMLLKMLIIATLVSGSSSSMASSAVPDVTHELHFIDSSTPAAATSRYTTWKSLLLSYDLVKAFVSCFDFFALYVTFNSFKLLGNDDTKVIGVALGWTLAEHVLSRLIPLYVSTISRGMEFEWAWFRGAIHANLSLYSYLSLSALVFLLIRWDKQNKRLLVGILGLLLTLLPLISQILCYHVLGDKLHAITGLSSSSIALVIYAVLTLVFGTISYVTYTRSNRGQLSVQKEGKRQ